MLLLPRCSSSGKAASFVQHQGQAAVTVMDGWMDPMSQLPNGHNIFLTKIFVFCFPHKN
jgi:hypothetical protein